MAAHGHVYGGTLSCVWRHTVMCMAHGHLCDVIINNILILDFQRKQLTLAPDDEGSSKYTKELESLQKILHFPEEVAVLLTEVESKLFLNVPPADYIRQVTLDLSRGSTVNSKVSRVEDLIHRFNEVIKTTILTYPN
jgi:hypothetical protein